MPFAGSLFVNAFGSMIFFANLDLMLNMLNFHAAAAEMVTPRDGPIHGFHFFSSFFLYGIHV